MAMFLSIAALLVLALLATSKRFYRVRRSRIGVAAVAGGWIATAVGALLGPFVSGLITPDAVLRATPLLSVGLGWIGLMVGLQARRDILAKLPAKVWRLTLVDAVASVGVVAGVLVLVTYAAVGTVRDAGLVALTLLAAASVGWSMETRSLRIEAAPGGHERAVLLRAAGGLCAIVAVTVFGVTAALLPFDLGVDQPARPATTRLFALLAACGIGVVLALIAKESLRLAGRHRAEMLLVFLGVVGLAAGVSADLGVSPLLPAMLTGAVLTNLRTQGPSDSAANPALFGRFILQAEHVVATIFALLAGVLLDPRVLASGLIVAGAIVLTRAALKPGVLAVVDRPPDAETGAARTARVAAIRQSPVAVALAVSMFILAPADDARRLLTVVVLVGFLCDATAALSIRRRPAREAAS